MRETIGWEVEGAGREWSDCKTKQPQRRRKGARSDGSVPLAMWFLKNSHGPWGFLEPKSWLPRKGHLGICPELEHPAGIHVQQ